MDLINYIFNLVTNKIDIVIYCAHAMTGRTPDELLYESQFIEKACKNLGLKVLDPVIAENVQPGHKPLNNTLVALEKYWARDKKMIRDAHVLVDVTGPAKSEGVAHEIGYARFCLWKPVIRVYPNLGPSIARFENDIIVYSIVDALVKAKTKWGKPRQRLWWRLSMLNRCLLKWIWYQIGEFK
jgi:hypothetical protein